MRRVVVLSVLGIACSLPPQEELPTEPEAEVPSLPPRPTDPKLPPTDPGVVSPDKPEPPTGPADDSWAAAQPKVDAEMFALRQRAFQNNWIGEVVVGKHKIPLNQEQLADWLEFLQKFNKERAFDGAVTAEDDMRGGFRVVSKEPGFFVFVRPGFGKGAYVTHLTGEDKATFLDAAFRLVDKVEKADEELDLQPIRDFIEDEEDHLDRQVITRTTGESPPFMPEDE